MGGAERYHPFFFIYNAVIANIDKNLSMKVIDIIV